MVKKKNMHFPSTDLEKTFMLLGILFRHILKTLDIEE